MRVFILTLQFLTRIPININIEAKKEDFAKGIIFFPVIGLFIGAFNMIFYVGAKYVATGLFPIICAILANCIITGALHIDGLADTCDGIFSARSKERMLEIMKDSRIGTNGAIAILFDFLFRISILQSFNVKAILIPLLLSPVIAKTLVALFIGFSADARTGGGMGSLFMEKSSRYRASGAFALGLAIVGAISGMSGILSLMICAVIMFIYKNYIYEKIGGMTGDTLGAANEVMEVVFLISYALIWRFI